MVRPRVWKLTVTVGRYADGSQRRVHTTAHAANTIDLPTARTVDFLLHEEIAGEEGFQRLLALFAMALSSSIAAPST